jgi:hypothetical protein
MYIDFQQLNTNTINDSYALPRSEEILETLGGNNYYSVLDMKSGYHQVEVEELHKQRTAFTVGPLGFYYFTFSWKNVHFVGESFKPLSCSRCKTLCILSRCSS